MAGKLADQGDAGRCGRCCLSYPDLQRPGQQICFRFGNHCARVAWNCKAPNTGYDRSVIKDEVLREVDGLRRAQI